MRNESLLREYIATALDPESSGNRAAQGAPLRQGEPLAPTAGGNVLDDEEREMASAPRSACVLIQSEDGRVLAVSRKDDPTAFGLPGGKVDPGETPEEAAARELAEETGLHATDLRLVYKREDVDSINHTYVAEISGEVDTDESGVIRWVSVEELLNGPFGDYNYRLFKHLGRI